MSTTRFPSGVTNVAQESALGNMGQPDPSKFQTVFDDFASLDATSWTVVETQAGATQAAAAGGGGLIALVNSAAIGDVNGFSTNLAIFALTAGKRFFAKARMSVADVANSNFFLGFGDTAAGLNPANGVYLQKTAAAGGTLSVVSELASVQTVASVTGVNAEMTGGVATVIGLEYDGRGTITGYLNDRKIVSLPVSSIPGTGMLGIWGYSNVNAFANTASLDYLLFAVER